MIIHLIHKFKWGCLWQYDGDNNDGQDVDNSHNGYHLKDYIWDSFRSGHEILI